MAKQNAYDDLFKSIIGLKINMILSLLTIK